MNYALNLADDGHILSVTYPKFASEDMVLVEALPEGNIPDYIYKDGEFIYDPIPEEEVVEIPTPQADTDAMMVDHEYRLTMLELGIFE